MQLEDEKSKPLRVLVVDNDQRILSIIREFLEMCKYEVTAAATGLDALMLLRSSAYNVLLTDIVMPDISGLGLIEIARKEFPSLPIIAMTGYGKQVKNLTSEIAPDHFLEKPFNLTELSNTISAVMNKTTGE